MVHEYIVIDTKFVSHFLYHVFELSCCYDLAAILAAILENKLLPILKMQTMDSCSMNT